MFIGPLPWGSPPSGWRRARRCRSCSPPHRCSDILWPIFNLAGIERAHIQPGATAASPLVLEYMPYSHSLVAALAGRWRSARSTPRSSGDVRTAIVLGL